MNTQNLKLTLEAQIEVILKECEQDLTSLSFLADSGFETLPEMKFDTPVFRYIWLKIRKKLEVRS